MKKVTAFIGSQRRRGTTYQAVLAFEEQLKQHDEIDFEIVFLSDYRLEFCQGCKQCFDQGEFTCPLKDDRDRLLEKMVNSDGVIFATPSYAFQVSARMKNLLDRFAFLYHRPRFFDKTFTAIVTQGVPAGKSVQKYLENAGGNMGFKVTGGSSVITLEPLTALRRQKLEREMRQCADHFYQCVIRPALSSPSYFRLLLFRLTRSGFKNAEVRFYDYDYYQKHGWFESHYYSDVRLNPFKKLAGIFFDRIGEYMIKHI